MNLETTTRLYERLLLVGMALIPAGSIWYLATFSPTPPHRFEHHLFHEAAIAIAILVGGFVSYVSWRSYRASGEVFLRWLTAGFLVFTLIYAPHGFLTRMAHHNIWLFLLFGPVSRFAMLACLVYGLAQYGKPPENPSVVSRSGFWWWVLLACGVINVAVAVLAYSPIASSPWVRMSLEGGAIVLCLAGIFMMIRRRIDSPLMIFYAMALALFAQAALAFILGKPWNHMWWLAHAVFAGGFFVLSWGVARALLTTRSFALAYSQEQLMRSLEAEKAEVEAANRDLHVSETRLQAVLDSVQDCVFTIDESGLLRSFNRSAERVFGYSADEIIGRPVGLLLAAPADKDEKGGVENHRSNGVAAMLGRMRETIGRRKDGIEFPVELAINETPVGSETLYTGSLRDVTAPRKAAEQLRIAATTFAIQEGVVTTDAASTILRVNPAFLSQTGFAVDDLVGKPAAILKSGLHDAAFYKSMWQQIVRSGGWRGEIFGRRKDGSTYPKMLTISAVRDESGAISHYVSTHSDITERKKAESELEQHRDHLEELVVSRTAELSQSRDEAEAANRAKSVFLATMSHELRTPMNGVIGMIDLVLRNATDPQQIDLLNKGKASAEHLTAVISDILDISRIEADRLALVERNFSLSQLIDMVIQMHEDAAGAKQLNFSIEIASNFPDLLHGDDIRLKQVLINLVDNAVKFSNHGTIEIRADALEQDCHTVLLRMAVRDQGIGIREEDHARVFEPFTQADDSVGRKYGGAGLGLTIVKRIAVLMGGEVGVESMPGEGSTFWVTARLHKQDATDSLPEAEVDAETIIRQDYGGARILLVDDDSINRMVARMQLEAVGLVVDLAKDGAEAINLARQSDYSAILMDIQMPVIDGLEATRRIRALPGRGHTPIIAMTANAFAEDRARSIEAGMNDFLVKPFKPGDLFSVLLRWLGGLARQV